MKRHWERDESFLAFMFTQAITEDKLSEITPQSVRNNKEAGRFELDVDGDLAVSYYKIRGKTIYFTHTEVPPAAEGRGIGNLLARSALDYARANGFRVVPRCKFIAAFIKRHPEYQNLVDVDDEA